MIICVYTCHTNSNKIICAHYLRTFFFMKCWHIRNCRAERNNMSKSISLMGLGKTRENGDCRKMIKAWRYSLLYHGGTLTVPSCKKVSAVGVGYSRFRCFFSEYIIRQIRACLMLPERVNGYGAPGAEPLCPAAANNLHC